MKPGGTLGARPSPYYMHAAKVPLASRISLSVRRDIFALFMSTMRPSLRTSVLDLGVTDDAENPESNFFEQMYPHRDRLVCASVENAIGIEEMYSGVHFVRIEADKPLPFEDRQFDLAFSSAVVEHTGGTENQRRFVAEMCRVGRRVFITTPNRWFPIEHHTAVPLLHYLPKWLYRRILRTTPFRYWSYERNLNLLTERELIALFPENLEVEVRRVGLGIGPVISNLAAYTLEPRLAPRSAAAVDR